MLSNNPGRYRSLPAEHIRELDQRVPPPPPSPSVPISRSRFRIRSSAAAARLSMSAASPTAPTSPSKCDGNRTRPWRGRRAARRIRPGDEGRLSDCQKLLNDRSELRHQGHGDGPVPTYCRSRTTLQPTLKIEPAMGRADLRRAAASGPLRSLRRRLRNVRRGDRVEQDRAVDWSKLDGRRDQSLQQPGFGVPSDFGA